MRGVGTLAVRRWRIWDRVQTQAGASRHLSSSATAEGADQSEQLRKRMERFDASMEGNAYVRILSSPLRRCALTGMVMPNSMMFSIVGFSTADEKLVRPPDVAEQLAAQEQELRSRTHPKAGARWVRRQAKPNLVKQLQRAKRMTKHKIVTSQTAESKAHFQAHLQTLDGQLNALHRPINVSRRLILTRQRKTSVIPSGKGEGRLERTSKATWVLLEQNVASVVGKVKSDRRFKGLQGDVVQQVGAQLEDDALDELKRLTKATFRKVQKPYLFTSADQTNPKRVAAILLTGDTDPGVKERAPTFNLTELFVDPERRTKVTKHLVEALGTTTFGGPLLLAQSVKTIGLCTALWRLHTWRSSEESSASRGGEVMDEGDQGEEG